MPAREMSPSRNICSSSIHGQDVIQRLQCLVKANQKWCKCWPNLMSQWKHLAETVSSPWSNQADVGNASIHAFALLYGGKDDDTLAKLRYLAVAHCSSLVHSVAFSSLMNCYGKIINHCATSIVCHSCSSFVCHSCSSFLHILQRLYL